MRIKVTKENFDDYIIFSIFSSKYWDKFVLEGSRALDVLSDENLVFRVLDDIDINADDNPNIEKIFRDIFRNNKDIEISFSELKKRTNNSESLFYNVLITYKKELKTNIDFTLETKSFDKVIKEKILFNRKIKIQTYVIEKYLANKIIASWKYKENTKREKTLFDVNFIVSNFDIDYLKFIKYYNYMNAKNIKIKDLVDDLIKFYQLSSLNLEHLNEELKIYLNEFYTKTIVANILDSLNKIKTEIEKF
ncbi:hypothetical protein [Mycoplasma procyoni]|uniref:hypothetical protein n=1 Tax=Mycoplasma procyoni TaxID=568784 RepID=UPI00197C5928|nr:hypothetical protein [Mycoplasma procyoni]MBN3534763.1 hypothetical protein [Mycoplasma procyoni]